jgi:hypothetical protein
VKKVTRLLFSSTLDITEGNAQNEDNPQDEYILTLADNKYKFPSEKLLYLNIILFQIMASELLIIQSVLWAILPYFFLHVSNLCSPYNEEGVDCFLSHQAHHGLFAGYVDYYLVINQSACALNEPDLLNNITIPLNCSNFTWYEQYSDSAQDIDVICFKMSFSDPLFAFAILTSFQKTILPVVFQVVIYIYLTLLDNCLRCLQAVDRRYCMLMLMRFLTIIQPLLAVIFINGCTLGLLFSTYIIDYLNTFDEKISTTVRLCIFVIGSLNFPSWLILSLYREGKDKLTIYQKILRQQNEVQGIPLREEYRQLN